MAHQAESSSSNVQRINSRARHRLSVQENPRSSRTVHKDWCFTLNNPTEEEIATYETVLSGNAVRYGIFQREVGELGTPHLQGYVELKRPRALSTMRQLFPRIHAEPRRGTRDQARDYCLKSNTAVPDSRREFGDWASGGQGARTDIRAVVNAIQAGATPAEVIVQFPAFVARHPRFADQFFNAIAAPRQWLTKVFVFYGPPGCGKSRLAYRLWPTLYSKPPGSAGGVWFNGYASHRMVLIDDFRGTDIPFEFLLQLLDRFSLLVPTKGGFAQFAPYIICITSNLPPSDWYHRSDPEQLAPLLRRLNHVYQFPISTVDRAQLTQLATYGSPGGLPLIRNE